MYAIHQQQRNDVVDLSLGVGADRNRTRQAGSNVPHLGRAYSMLRGRFDKAMEAAGIAKSVPDS